MGFFILIYNYMKYIKNYKLFKEATSLAIENEKKALEDRWNDFKSKKSSIPSRVDSFLKTGDMRSVNLQLEDLKKSSLKDLLTKGSDQTVNKYTMQYLNFVIGWRKKLNESQEEIKKHEVEIQNLSSSKPTDEEGKKTNDEKIKSLREKIMTLQKMQSEYNKSVMDKEKELENMYNDEKRELETELNLTKDLERKEEVEKKAEENQ